MKILALTRAPQFSPNSVERDKAIIEAVAKQLQTAGCETVMMSEEEYVNSDVTLRYNFAGTLVMARLPEALRKLCRQGLPAINSPQALLTFSRSHINTRMAELQAPMPPAEGPDGYWIKRGDACAQTKGDVVFCKDTEALARAKRLFATRGITDYVVSAHVQGDLVKFYGVHGTPFFSCSYPTEGGHSKFGDESHNGQAMHYAFSRQSLHHWADTISAATAIDIYGGDAIVRADGSFCIIDFNDWPSFSSCREEAAKAIAGLALRKLHTTQ
jgi:hypothetical protein